MKMAEIPSVSGFAARFCPPSQETEWTRPCLGGRQLKLSRDPKRRITHDRLRAGCVAGAALQGKTDAATNTRGVVGAHCIAI
jgi:hypothetical protein